MTVDPWALPSPLDVIAVALVHVVQLVAWFLLTVTRNVGELGPWYVVVYWLAVWGCAALGANGSAKIRVVRRGADFFEFDPARRGGAWAGRWAVGIVRLQVAGEAWVAAAKVIAGYGGLAVLLTVGIVWRWLPVILVAVAWLVWRARTRAPWWEQDAG